MIILPKNYDNKYECISGKGANSRIYKEQDSDVAYKIYRKGFSYDEAKMNEFYKMEHPNCISPKDVVAVGTHNELSGYSMLYDDGRILRQLGNVSLTLLIESSLGLSDTIKEVSEHHFVITDPNVDNVIFSDAFKLVDTYSFLLAKKMVVSALFKKNMNKVNETMMCGLLDYSYRRILEEYLRVYGRYEDIFDRLNRQSEQYVYELLSIIQETTGEETIGQAKSKMISTINR